MKKFLLAMFMVFGLILVTPSNAEATGFFYTNATYPVTATGVSITDNSKLKKGSSSITNVLYIVEVGDASIDEAVKKAGIKKISYVDMQEESILIFWRKLTINVYGE